MSEEVFTEGGRLLKMEVDYSATVDEKVPVCEQLAKVSSVIIPFDPLTNHFDLVSIYLPIISISIRPRFNLRKESCRKRWTLFWLLKNKRER